MSDTNGALQALINISHRRSQSYEGDLYVDENVLAKFPEGTKIFSASRFRTSAWAVTARLRLILPNDSEEQYFLKVASGYHGQTLLQGEFNAMSELYKWAPDLVPKPHAWGKYTINDPETFFFLSEYIDMRETMPDPYQLCAKLASLHRESVSPTGQFGFHVTTCQGRVPQSVGWEHNWTKFFTKLLRHVISMDFEFNGYWEELDKVERRFIDYVVPRLLGALEQDGRTIKPSLIHGDLWEGNTGTSLSGNVCIFDAASFYAHHEMEVGDWRCHYNKIHDMVYREAYLRYNIPSEPEEEWDDRNRLYCIYYNTIYSCNHLDQGKAVRQQAYRDMYYLIDKYAPFPEGEGPRKLDESEMASLSAERDHTLEV